MLHTGYVFKHRVDDPGYMDVSTSMALDGFDLRNLILRLIFQPVSYNNQSTIIKYCFQGATECKGLSRLKMLSACKNININMNIF